jgi:ATP-dependent 26S proteasome regulatory subunit
VLIIGPPGIGKTAFMKYYAKRQSKILLNANCSNLVVTFKHQVPEVINLLFEMANFSTDSILFFDDIDLIMND